MSSSSIWSIDKTLSGATIPGQSAPGSDGNEGVLRSPQSSSITEASPSDYLVSYPGLSLQESYPSAEMQSVYSTAPADWAYQEGIRKFRWKRKLHIPRNIRSEHYQTAIKLKVRKEYLGRTRNFLGTKVCKRNLIKGISRLWVKKRRRKRIRQQFKD